MLPRPSTKSLLKGAENSNCSPRWLAEYLHELTSFPNGKYDDRAIALIGWHIPAVFELALRWDWLHKLEHASFLGTGVMFWWPIVQPWPSRPRWPEWAIPLYLFCATLPCDALSGFLTFCEQVVYPSYISAPRVFGLSALEDQECAAALMWVAVTIIFLVPAVLVTLKILSPSKSHLPVSVAVPPATSSVPGRV